MDISRQAKTYLWIWIFTTIINVIVSVFSVLGIYGFLTYVVFMVISIPFTLLYIYNIDCLTYGNCDTWSWFITILSSIGLIFTTIMMIISAVVYQKIANSVNEFDTDNLQIEYTNTFEE